MGDVSHLESETIPNEGTRRKSEESIIRPRRRAGGGSSEEEIDLGGGYSFVRMMSSSIGNTHGVNIVLLD